MPPAAFRGPAAFRERYLIWGAGGHGKVVADLVRALGHELVGFVDADAAKVGQVVEPGGARVLLTDEALGAALARDGCYPHGASALALAVGDNARRQRCLGALDGRHVPALVHPTATCSPSASFGRGAVVFARAVVNADAHVDAGAIVNSGAIVEHDCYISYAAHISPGAVLAGRVRVGARSWIGAGAVVIHGRTVGRDAIVGAGAVVIRDVPDDVTVVGNPGRVLGDVARLGIAGGVASHGAAGRDADGRPDALSAAVAGTG